VQRILESIRVAKSRGASLRVGPELGMCAPYAFGYVQHYVPTDIVEQKLQ